MNYHSVSYAHTTWLGENWSIPYPCQQCEQRERHSRYCPSSRTFVTGINNVKVVEQKTSFVEKESLKENFSYDRTFIRMI